MRRIADWLKGLLGLGALAVLTVVLVLLFRPAGEGEPVAQQQSPIGSPSPPAKESPFVSPLPTPTPTRWNWEPTATAMARITPSPYPTPLLSTPMPTPTLPLAPPPPTMIPPAEFEAEKLVVADVRLFDSHESIIFRAWSPDGKRILVQRAGAGYNPAPDPKSTPTTIELPSGKVTVPAGCCVELGDLWMMNADGTERRQIADLVGAQAWSPDGKYIAYTAPLGEEGAEGGVYVVSVETVLAQDVDKGELAPHQESRGIYCPDPNPLRLGWKIAEGDLLGSITWLPDDRLIFLRDGYLYAIRPDGTEEQPLNNIHIGSKGIDARPGEYKLSPDGRHILCLPAIDPDRGETWEWLMVDLDGSNVRFWERELTAKGLVKEEEGVEISYHFKGWSPDGRQLVFEVSKYRPVERAWRGDLWVMDVDGSNPHVVYQSTEDYVTAHDPTWSPDGRVIAFAEGPGLHTKLCMVNQDGTGLWCPETLPTPASFPQWSPTGTQIIYRTQFGIVKDGISGTAAGPVIVTLAVKGD